MGPQSFDIEVHCHHSVFCLTTGPKPPLKRFLHIVWSRASSFKWEYPLLSLKSSSSFLRLLPRLLVTSISLFIFPSITCFRRQFVRKMWPIQLAFRFLISCRIFLCSLTLSNTSSFSHDWSNWSSPSFSSTTFQNFPGISDLLPETSKVNCIMWKNVWCNLGLGFSFDEIRARNMCETQIVYKKLMFEKPLVKMLKVEEYKDKLRRIGR